MNKTQRYLKKELTEVFDKYMNSLKKELYIEHLGFRCPYCEEQSLHMPIMHGKYDIIYCRNCDMFYVGL